MNGQDEFEPPMTLDEIAIKHGTDKATKHPLIKGHGYAPWYDDLFRSFRWKEIKFLEIGVGGGESIRTWLEYFPRAKVFGVDNNQGTNEWNTVGDPVDVRYKFVYGDQSDPTFWKCFAADYGSNWTIIIDDGGHKGQEVITSFEGLWPLVASGGLYCIEDLLVAYGQTPNQVEFLKELVDDMHKSEGLADIEAVFFFRELAVLFKK